MYAGDISIKTTMPMHGCPSKANRLKLISYVRLAEMMFNESGVRSDDNTRCSLFIRNTILLRTLITGNVLIDLAEWLLHFVEEIPIVTKYSNIYPIPSEQFFACDDDGRVQLNGLVRMKYIRIIPAKSTNLGVIIYICGAFTRLAPGLT